MVVHSVQDVFTKKLNYFRNYARFFEICSVFDIFTYTGYIITVANRFAEQPIADFPCKYAGTFAFVVSYLLDNGRGGYPRFRSTDGTRFYRASLVVSISSLLIIPYSRYSMNECNVYSK